MATRSGRNVGSSTVVEGGMSRVMCYFWSVRRKHACWAGYLGMQAACQRPIRGTSQGSVPLLPAGPSF